MIKIKIKNPKKIIKNEKGWLASKIAPFVIDIDKKVESIIADELKKKLKERDIEAEISIEVEKNK